VSQGALVREVHRRLIASFGPLEPPRIWDPLEELILTVLSQNTSDTNSSRAYAALRARFGTWADVAAAEVAEVINAIRSGGLANTKGPRIHAIVCEIERREGGFDLSWMREADDERVSDYLASLPGVGPKTVACVLAFSLGRDVLPVDTHVHRVAGRLGLIPEKATAEAAHRILHDEVPPKLRLEMHMGMIKLGREVCKAQKPRCVGCSLVDVCPTGRGAA